MLLGFCNQFYASFDGYLQQEMLVCFWNQFYASLDGSVQKAYMLRIGSQKIPIRIAIHFFWILIGSRSICRKLDWIWNGSEYMGENQIRSLSIGINHLENLYCQIFCKIPFLRKSNNIDSNFRAKKRRCTWQQKFTLLKEDAWRCR